VVTTAGVVVVEPDNELFEPIDELLLEELEEELDLLESKPEEELDLLESKPEEELDLLESELEEELDLPEPEPEEELDLLESEPEAVTLAAMTITPSKAVIRDWEERMVFMDTIDFLVGESRDDRDFAVSRRRRDEEDRDGQK
jgi:predicted Zn-dependent protease